MKSRWKLVCAGFDSCNRITAACLNTLALRQLSHLVSAMLESSANCPYSQEKDLCKVFFLSLVFFFPFIAAAEAGLWATGCCLSSWYLRKCILCMQDPAQQRGRQKIAQKVSVERWFKSNVGLTSVDWSDQLPFQMVSDQAPEHPCCWGTALTRLQRNLGPQPWSCPGHLMHPANSLPLSSNPLCCPCPRVREWT